MHFSGLQWQTMEIRHLVLAYLTVFAVQGGYFAYVLLSWLRVDEKDQPS